MEEAMNDKEAQRLGFRDANDFYAHVSAAPMGTPEAIAAFKRWQADDGTRAGLLALSDAPASKAAR